MPGEVKRLKYILLQFHNVSVLPFGGGFFGVLFFLINTDQHPENPPAACIFSVHRPDYQRSEKILSP